ncbi:hypothetical protein SFOMI_1257 [Sphingobium fuliginis]|uniref:Uncharacterized protein n=1 Tax=Sphingobium fuliginis (strain ATCC 27551) TaxID=336203 RepID=A0A292ZB74_SPHSA|nr:hypothetical protein SFOMI_1257 [Sphingobium fuliginis]
MFHRKIDRFAESPAAATAEWSRIPGATRRGGHARTPEHIR